MKALKPTHGGPGHLHRLFRCLHQPSRPEIRKRERGEEEGRMHLMHPPSVVSCSQRRRPLLPPCNAQSEAFSRRVRANGAALGVEPEAGKIYTAGFIESAQTLNSTVAPALRTLGGRGDARSAPGLRSAPLSWGSSAGKIWSGSCPRVFPSVIPASTAAPSTCSH